MVEAIEGRGGKVFVRCPVASLLLEKGVAVGVRLANGDEILARRVVSAVGYRATEAILKASSPPPPPPPNPLPTQQSAGFVMVGWWVLL